MSPKIKMSDIYDGDDMIELTDEELKEILEDDNFDAAADYETAPIPEYYFTNPDPYAKFEPRSPDAPKRDVSFDEKGNIVVKNPSVFWLPEITITEEIGGTEFTITGSYEGTETLDKKLKRIMQHQAANDESDITEDSE